MFHKPTVFILGAGASWHYGFPTGEDLVKKAIAKADEVAAYFLASYECSSEARPNFVMRNDLEAPPSSQRAVNQWAAAAAEAQKLASRLKQVNPTVIDYFLEQNTDLHDIGRLVIAMVLLDCEVQYHRDGNTNRRDMLARQKSMGAAPTDAIVDIRSFNDDWLRFVLYKLTSNCGSSNELANNRVRFVTFNYDLSLETRLRAGLGNISLFDASDIDAFFAADRVIHTYGKLREAIEPPRTSDSTLPSVELDNSLKLRKASMARFDLAFEASKGIRIIGGPEKEQDKQAIVMARAAIAHAEFVYILGYGFDANNNERLGLGPALGDEPEHNRNVLFTNFMGHNRISKAAGRLMRGQQDAFLPPNPPSRTKVRFSPQVNAQLHYHWEVSTKNVYDALAEDFESLETERA